MTSIDGGAAEFSASVRNLVPSISVFFPAFNDAASLPGLISATFEALRRRIPNHEVIVVNDGSTDGTANVLHVLRQKYHPHLRIVTHEANRGYGAALRSGFEAATKDWVFYTDGDGQYDPGQLDLLLDAVTERTGLVNGYKVQRHDPWHRIAIGSVYNAFARAIFGIGLKDIDCDFRLIRRDLLQSIDLRSASGTICVELVKKLEMSGAEIVEVPVSHYPRLHGTSQFFRVKSLAFTFLQLCGLFLSLVLQPAVRRLWSVPPGSQDSSSPSLRSFLVMATVLASLGMATYARALSLPFIADDYLQIELGQLYGPLAKWGELAQDVLYRCRATSLLMTHWTERLFGLSEVAFNATSLAVHVVNSILVYLLGIWRHIGWKLSAVAAAFFAVSSHHQEAVIWYAALPELLVFSFAVSSFLCWVVWVQTASHTAWFGSIALFLIALLSKESAVAVVPLMAMALLCQGGAFWKRLPALLPFAAFCIAYFLLAFQNRGTHLHFNDGTFSLAAPFLQVLANSVGRLLWIWGALSIVALGFWRAWEFKRVIILASLWMIIALLPYSFLTYMLRVPSRHTYFASAGLAMIVGAGLLEVAKQTRLKHGRWAVSALATVIAIHHVIYIWTGKHRQFLVRAAPTEELISIVNSSTGPVYLKCFPYHESIANLAVRHGTTPENKWREVVIGPEALKHPNAIDLCNDTAGRGRY